MSARSRPPRSRPQVAPDQALRTSGRKPWDKMLAWLRAQAESADPGPFAREVLGQFDRFEDALAHDEAGLIANPLRWTDEDRDFGLWIESAFHAFSRLGARVLRRLCEGPELALGKEPAGEMAAFSLAMSGAAIKWAEIAGAGRRAVSIAEVHRVFAMADAHGLRNAPVALAAAPAQWNRDIDAHYARVLLLDAFCRGNLGRQQVAIADCWLLEWCRAYRVVDGPVHGACLVVDTKGTRGLRPAPGGDAKDLRCLAIEPMGEQIRQAVGWFHEGRIYPGHGGATAFRVEEHVAVLDHLRGFLRMARRGTPDRQARHGREARVEAYVGLAEILAKAFTPGSVETLQPSPPLLEPPRGAPAMPRSVVDMQYEVPLRLLRLVDESAGGLGLESDESEPTIEVGTLVAIRREPCGPALLCEVVRRVAVPGSPTRLGARVLSHDMVKLSLARAGSRAGAAALFLPGADSCGRGDCLLVSQSDFDPRAPMEIAFPDRVYDVRLNRIRHQGRGWVLAGLEVAGERPGAPPLQVRPAA